MWFTKVISFIRHVFWCILNRPNLLKNSIVDILFERQSPGHWLGAVLLWTICCFKSWESSMQHQHKISTENLCASSFQKPVRLSPSRSWGLLITAKKVAPLTRARTPGYSFHMRGAHNLPIQSPSARRTHTRIIFCTASLVNHNKSRIWKSLFLSPTDADAVSGAEISRCWKRQLVRVYEYSGGDRLSCHLGKCAIN